MAEPIHAAELPVPSEDLKSNKPYRLNSATQAGMDDKELAKEQQQSLDSEKQVVSSEEQLGASNAPMVHEQETHPTTMTPIREADKEVTSSWQMKSREEDAPIPISNLDTPSGELMNDYKGPPPTYDSLNRQSRAASDSLSSPSTHEPDDSGVNLHPRPEDTSAVGRLLSWIPSAPRIPSSRMPHLIQPVTIPQLEVPPPGESVPFDRCYSDALASRDVPIQEFTAFLDGLALAQAPNSVLQGFKVFGTGAGSVPLPFTNLAGKGIAALATSGSGHSGSRARLYIERAKKEYFEPRGLRMSIVRDNDLNPRLQIPAHASRLAPLTRNTLTSTTCKRRTEGLAPYVAPLRFNCPEQDKQTQGVHKTARKQLDKKFKEQSDRLRSSREVQWNDVAHSGPGPGNWDARYADKMAQLRKTQLGLIQAQSKFGAASESSTEVKELLDALQQDQRDLQMLSAERQMALQNLAGSNRGIEEEMKEVQSSQKLKWIVIDNLE